MGANVRIRARGEGYNLKVSWAIVSFKLAKEAEEAVDKYPVIMRKGLQVTDSKTGLNKDWVVRMVDKKQAKKSTGALRQVMETKATRTLQTLRAAAMSSEAEIHELWMQLDSDLSDSLDEYELGMLLSAMDMQADPSTVLNEIDTDNNGTADWDEFLIWWRSQARGVVSDVSAQLVRLNSSDDRDGGSSPGRPVKTSPRRSASPMRTSSQEQAASAAATAATFGAGSPRMRGFAAAAAAVTDAVVSAAQPEPRPAAAGRESATPPRVRNIPRSRVVAVARLKKPAAGGGGRGPPEGRP